MEQTYSIQQKIRQLLIILGPILITQISLCAMTFFDTTMSGHASSNDLVGVAIGANIWMPIFSGFNGVLLAVVPIIAQLLGAERKEKVPFIIIQGIYLAMAIGVFVIICGSFTINLILDMMDLDSVIYGIALNFLKAISFGIIPFFVSCVLRSFIDTLGYTRVTMLITIATLPINILLNYVLIFGKFGFPCLGGVGAGYASAITYWCNAIISGFVIHRIRPFKDYHVLNKFYSLSLSAWKELLKIGIPIGSAIFCETSIFAVITLLMSQFNTATIAAYQAAMNFSSLLYMIPLSISMTLTIVIGFEVGAKRFKDAKQYSYLGISIAVVMAISSAIILSFHNEQVAALYTKDEAVLELAQAFLLYAAFFQLSDAVAAPIQGVLRGYKDVRITFIMAIVSYWVIGLPLGHVLVKYSSFGAFGYWIGLIIGLAVSAACLATRMVRLQRKTV